MTTAVKAWRDIKMPCCKLDGACEAASRIQALMSQHVIGSTSDLRVLAQRRSVLRNGGLNCRHTQHAQTMQNALPTYLTLRHCTIPNQPTERASQERHKMSLWQHIVWASLVEGLAWGLKV